MGYFLINIRKEEGEGREFIDYYKTRGTTVYVTFLDASKTFDRFDHWILFDKMIKKGIIHYLVASFLVLTSENVSYAGRIYMYVPSVFVLQTVLNRAVLFRQCFSICKEYASTHMLLYMYNGSKSFSLCFKKNTLKVSSSSFYLDQIKIPIVEQCRYLGITISTNNSDVDLKGK